MKIYTMVKIDMDTGEILAEDSFEYAGPLALAVDGTSETRGSGSIAQTASGESGDPGEVDPGVQADFDSAYHGGLNNSGGSSNSDSDITDRPDTNKNDEKIYDKKETQKEQTKQYELSDFFSKDLFNNPLGQKGLSSIDERLDLRSPSLEDRLSQMTEEAKEEARQEKLGTLSCREANIGDVLEAAKQTKWGKNLTKNAENLIDERLQDLRRAENPIDYIKNNPITSALAAGAVIGGAAYIDNTSKIDQKIEQSITVWENDKVKVGLKGFVHVEKNEADATDMHLSDWGVGIELKSK